jgi:hypothetical protein
MLSNVLNDDTVFWTAIAVIACVAIFFSYRERASRHRMIETLAEKGQPIPPELLGKRWAPESGHTAQSGIYLICSGIALAVFFWGLTGWGNPFDPQHEASWLPVIGIFPFMMGVARILGSFFDRPSPQK